VKLKSGACFGCNEIQSSGEFTSQFRIQTSAWNVELMGQRPDPSHQKLKENNTMAVEKIAAEKRSFRRSVR